MSIYNETESQIRESVSSVLQQTLKDFELIIICDNPKRSDVIEILDSFGDERIRYFVNDNNIGLAMSMNKAASLAMADVFARMDADDIAAVERFAIEYELLSVNNCDLVFSSYSLIDDNSNPLPRFEKIEHDLNNVSIQKEIAFNPTIIHHPTVMMRRSLFEKVGGYRDFPCSQDADLWLRMQEAGCIFYRSSKQLIKYRINTQGVSQKKWMQQRLTWYYIFNLSLERIENGIDSYSKEGYYAYLNKNGIGNETAENKLRKSFSLLKKAQSKTFLRPLVLLYIFFTNPLLRRYYLQVIKKRRLLKK